MEKQPETGAGKLRTRSFLEALGGLWPHSLGNAETGHVWRGLVIKRGLQKALLLICWFNSHVSCCSLFKFKERILSKQHEVSQM